jgi:beta-phosphoglucomutase-like phosphatase (HAD superfamily)
VLGLPDGIRGCLFDLDGALTKTAQARDAAWQEMFGGCRRDRPRRAGEPFVPFDRVKDYAEFVDGKPRADGRFGFVAGVDRLGQADALADHGADVVVTDLAELPDRT